MKARVSDYSAEEVIAVIEWAHTSGHDRAQFLRKKGCTKGNCKTLWRPDNFAEYLDMAQEPAPRKRGDYCPEPGLLESLEPTEEEWAEVQRRGLRLVPRGERR